MLTLALALFSPPAWTFPVSPPSPEQFDSREENNSKLTENPGGKQSAERTVRDHFRTSEQIIVFSQTICNMCVRNNERYREVVHVAMLQY